MDKSTNVRATRSKTSRKPIKLGRPTLTKNVVNHSRMELTGKKETLVPYQEISIRRPSNGISPCNVVKCKLPAIEYDASKTSWKLRDSITDDHNEDNNTPLQILRIAIPSALVEQEEDGVAANKVENEQEDTLVSPKYNLDEGKFKESGINDCGTDANRYRETGEKTSGNPKLKTAKKYRPIYRRKKTFSHHQKTNKSSRDGFLHTHLVKTKLPEYKDSEKETSGMSYVKDKNDSNYDEAQITFVQAKKSATATVINSAVNEESIASATTVKSGDDLFHKKQSNEKLNEHNTGASEGEGLSESSSDSHVDSQKYRGDRDSTTAGSNWPYTPSEFQNVSSTQYANWFSQLYNKFHRPSWDSTVYNPACSRPAWDSQLYLDAKERFRRKEANQIKRTSGYGMPWVPTNMSKYMPPGTAQPPIYDMFRFQNQPNSQYPSSQKMLRSSNVGQLSKGISSTIIQNTMIHKINIAEETATNRDVQNNNLKPNPNLSSTTTVNFGHKNSVLNSKAAKTQENSVNYKLDQNITAAFMHQGVQTPYNTVCEQKLNSFDNSAIGFTIDPSENPSRVLSRRRCYSTSWKKRQDDHRKRIKKEKAQESIQHVEKIPVSMRPLPRVALLSKPNSNVSRSGNGGYYSPSIAFSTTAQIIDENGRLKPQWNPSPFVGIGKKNAWDETVPKSDYYRLQYYGWRQAV